MNQPELFNSKYSRRNVTCPNGTTLRLTPQRAAILELLLKNSPEPVSRATLAIVAGNARTTRSNEATSDDTVKVQICHLRQEINDVNLRIVTHAGGSYAIE